MGRGRPDRGGKTGEARQGRPDRRGPTDCSGKLTWNNVANFGSVCNSSQASFDIRDSPLFAIIEANLARPCKEVYRALM